MDSSREYDPYYSRRELRLLVLSLMVPMITVSFSQTVINTALPTMLSDLDAPASVAWVVAAFLVTSTIAMVGFGSLGDQADRKLLILIALGIFGIGSVVGGFAPSVEVVIIARLVQGLGGGGVMVLTQTIMAHAAPARERARYAGAFGSVWAVATIGGALLGGWMTDGPGWAWTFWVNVPFVALAAVLLLRWVRRSIPGRGAVRPDILGIVLLAILTTGIVGMTSSATSLAGQPVLLAALIAAVVLIGALFLIVERRAVMPTLPGFLLRDRTFLIATTAGILTNGISMFAVLSYLPTFAQMVLGFSAMEAGALLLPLIFGTVAASTLTGFFVSSTGRYKAIPIAGTLLATIALGLLGTLSASSQPWELVAYSTMLGLGTGSSVLLLTLIVQDALPRSIVGSGTAANNYFRQAGASVGVSFLGAVFATRLGDALARAADDLPGVDSFDPRMLRPESLEAMSAPVRLAVMDAYGTALPPLFGLLAPLTLLAAILLCFLPRRPLSGRTAGPVVSSP